MSGVVASAPVAVFLLVGLVVVAVLVGTAARRRDLSPAAGRARRHGLTTGGVAVTLGVTAAVAVGLGGSAAPWTPGVSLVLAPLVFGCVHAAVLGLGEHLWPRPRGDVRTAVATRRTLPAGSRWLLRALGAVTLLVVVTCAVGWTTAGGDGRSLTVALETPVGLDGAVGPSTTGPYPGVVFVLPALIGTASLLLLTALALRAALQRSAVPGGQDDELTLRHASVHRVLRGSTVALLALLAGLWVVGGAALHTAGQDTVVGVDGLMVVIEGSRGLRVAGTTGILGGAGAAAAALALHLLPAPRLRTPTAPGPVVPVQA